MSRVSFAVTIMLFIIIIFMLAEFDIQLIKTAKLFGMPCVMCNDTAIWYLDGIIEKIVILRDKGTYLTFKVDLFQKYKNSAGSQRPKITEDMMYQKLFLLESEGSFSLPENNVTIHDSSILNALNRYSLISSKF